MNGIHRIHIDGIHIHVNIHSSKNADNLDILVCNVITDYKQHKVNSMVLSIISLSGSALKNFRRKSRVGRVPDLPGWYRGRVSTQLLYIDSSIHSFLPSIHPFSIHPISYTL